LAPATVVIDNVEFGQCQLCMAAFPGCTIDISLGYKIVGNQGWHLYANGGVISNQSVLASTITLNGTPSFAAAFCTSVNAGFVYIGSFIFSGAGTGKRYDASLNGIINSGGSGPTYLPGDVAGTTASGGQYV
jgi:hypothetical protein